MNEPFFSEREFGPQPRVQEEISENAWGGIIAAIKSFIADGSFGYRYPRNCKDGEGPYGCDEDLFFQALRGDVPELPPQLPGYEVPSTFVILDAIQFCYWNVAKPIQGKYHDYFSHYHLQFEPQTGQKIFRDRINQIFARNGIAYQLEANGRIIRLLPQVVQESITSTEFRTGDTELDSLLETARNKFFDRDPTIRRESLEKLWDAWERLKTVEMPGKDNKPVSADILLGKAADEEHFRQLLGEEARTLTRIGNDFMIRHWETYKIPIQRNEDADYFFLRLFALIRLLLKATNRGG